MTSPLSSARINGSFSTLYKQAFLSRLLHRMTNDDTGPLSYTTFFGGCPSYQLASSFENFPAVHLFKWLNTRYGMKEIPKDIEVLRPYLERFRDINLITKTDRYGYADPLYLPGDLSLVASFLRPLDKLNVYETRPEYVSMIETVFAKDRRVRLLHDDIEDEYVVKHAMPPLTRRGIVHFDLGHSPTYNEQLQVRNLLLNSLKRYPDGTYIISYPIKKGYLPWTVFRAFAAMGVKNAYNFAVYADFSHIMKRFIMSIPSVDDDIPDYLTKEEARYLLEKAYESSVLAQFDDQHDIEDSRPLLLKDYLPPPEWEGVGIAILNGPTGIDDDAKAVCNALKTIFKLPKAAPTQRFTSIHDEEITEFGDSIKRFSYRRGPPLPEEFTVLDFQMRNRALLEQFTRELLPHVEYTGHFKKTTDFEQLFDETANYALTQRFISMPKKAVVMKMNRSQSIKALKEYSEWRVNTAKKGELIKNYIRSNDHEIAGQTEIRALDDAIKSSNFQLMHNQMLDKKNTFVEDEARVRKEQEEINLYNIKKVNDQLEQSAFMANFTRNSMEPDYMRSTFEQTAKRNSQYDLRLKNTLGKVGKNN